MAAEAAEAAEAEAEAEDDCDANDNGSPHSDEAVEEEDTFADLRRDGTSAELSLVPFSLVPGAGGSGAW